MGLIPRLYSQGPFCVELLEMFFPCLHGLTSGTPIFFPRYKNIQPGSLETHKLTITLFDMNLCSDETCVMSDLVLSPV